MPGEGWQRIEEIFLRAVELSPEARSAFLDAACGEDEALRKKIEILLAHDREDGNTFAAPAEQDFVYSGASSVSAGDRLGPYEIVELVGAGGMGEVYKAYDTRLGREVALKILPVDLANDASLQRRFESEARVVARLNHPNIVAVFDVGKENGLSYIVSELIDGASLRGVQFELAKIVEIGSQIASGLAAAHDVGIIHRDLKPENILLTRDGRVKILDFGLAKVGAEEPKAIEPTESLKTGPGVVMGTVGYMSPEQIRGLPLNKKSDLFSFGVVLYELVVGERPFKGNSALAVADAILHAQPRDINGSHVPSKFKAIIRKLLEKDPTNRYASAQEVSQDLNALVASIGPDPTPRFSRRARIAGASIFIILGALGAWLWRVSSQERWALNTATPEIERLIDEGEFAKASAMAQKARAILPNNPGLNRLWSICTGEVTIASEPPGATVFFRLYLGDPNAWQTLGKTPLNKIRLPLAGFALRVAKPGFADVFYVGRPVGAVPPGTHADRSLKLKLRPAKNVPPGMLLVQAGFASLGHPLVNAPVVRPVDDFLIDQYEITNEEYKKFVDAGGYQRREFWKQPFLKDGRTIPWEDAMALFHDSTGRPGPATWEAGDYRKGYEKHPVAGVSWFEAAAYAEFAGKSLPTAYHWMRASGSMPLMSSGSNFKGEGTQPVGSPAALSGFGTRDMAGNVKEWCWNQTKDGNRFILGGGFDEPTYMFNFTDAQSPWERRADFGFRCVKLDSPLTAALAAPVESAPARDYWKEKPVSDEVFKAYSAQFAYDKGELNARVEETATAEAWSRVKVTFDAAYGHERIPAYLYLPKNAKPPFQTLIYFPGGFALLDEKFDLASFEETRGFLIRNGRAMFVPIFKGTYERRDGLMPGFVQMALFRDHAVAWAKDVGRSLDYLETRDDIDRTRLAYFGDSLGGTEGAFIAAVEKRLKVAIFSSGGLHISFHYLPATDPMNYAPHVKVPVLMLNGRYDTTFPLESSQRPFFQLLGTPDKDKKHVVYESGHGAFPRPDAVRECLDWLDKYLGPVRR